MPIHGYECKNEECKYEYEVFYQSQSQVKREEPEEECPKCGSKEKERQVPKGTSFQLKGRWFKQGY